MIKKIALVLALAFAPMLLSADAWEGDYMLVCANTPQQLSANVTRYAHAGWIVWGSPTSSAQRTASNGDMVFFFCQAMVRH